MEAKTFAKQIPGFMALGLMGQSLKMVPKNFGGKQMKGKKQSSKDFVKGSVKILTGIPFVSAVSESVNQL